MNTKVHELLNAQINKEFYRRAKEEMIKLPEKQMEIADFN